MMNAREAKMVLDLIDKRLVQHNAWVGIQQIQQAVQSGQSGLPKDQLEKALEELKQRREQAERDVKIVMAELQTGGGA